MLKLADFVTSGTCNPPMARVRSFAFLPLLGMRLEDSMPFLDGILSYDLWKTFPSIMNQPRVSLGIQTLTP